jgi:hypothetical protein
VGHGTGFGTFMYAAAGYIFTEHLKLHLTSAPKAAESRPRTEAATKLWQRLVRMNLARVVHQDRDGLFFQMDSGPYLKPTELSRAVDRLLNKEDSFARRLPKLLGR